MPPRVDPFGKRDTQVPGSLRIGEHGKAWQRDPLDELEGGPTAGRDELEGRADSELVGDPCRISSGSDMEARNVREGGENLSSSRSESRVLRSPEWTIPKHGPRLL